MNKTLVPDQIILIGNSIIYILMIILLMIIIICISIFIISYTIKMIKTRTTDTASNNNLSITNSMDIDIPLRYDTIGYIIQDGYPTPDNPVDIQSADDTKINVYGKNLFL